MEKEKQSKQYDNLRKSLNYLLKDFERNKQWADISNWLYRLHDALKSKKFTDLPLETHLAKRLAQCLNPSLPSGVHASALKVYSLILTNFSNRVALLPLMSIGLFPFFENCNSQLKLDMLKIFEFFFMGSHEVVQMLTSLMNALLTGLNENNEELAKRIYALCDKISRSLGRIWIDGAVWVNILKSPKVRVAGFKYFMKVFKDREKLKSENQINEEPPNFPEGENLDPQERTMLEQIFEERNKPDTPEVRFPNFSALGMSALCACLESNETDAASNNLVKRSALDLCIHYLKLSGKSIVSERDAVILVQTMVQILKGKEFSLTRRVYTYLFDQPNMEGVYIIDPKNRQYELLILEKCLNKLLCISKKNFVEKEITSETVIGNGVLNIIQTLVIDHPKLADIMLERLAFSIIHYIHAYCFQNCIMMKQILKNIREFYLNVIQPNRSYFLGAILNKIDSLTENIESSESNESEHSHAILILDFYLKKIEKIGGLTFKGPSKRKESTELKFSELSISENQANNKQPCNYGQYAKPITDKLINYLLQSNYTYVKVCTDVIELCKLFQKEAQNWNMIPFLNEEQVSIIDKLISLAPNKNIYVHLIDLHPNPAKEVLLLYINEGPYGLTCIKHLLAEKNHPNLSENEKEELFFAIFKLLNCHLWEDKAVEFIRLYLEQYPEHFHELINKLDPAEWLMYWKKMGGMVAGGVVRMVQNIQNQNPISRHLSAKWIEDSSMIIGKIIDPIYCLFSPKKPSLIGSGIEMKESQETKETKDHIKRQEEFQEKQAVKVEEVVEKSQNNIEDVKFHYRLIKNVFEASKKNFVKYLFVQQDKYLNPLMKYVFTNLKGDSDIKSQSMAFLHFILSQTSNFEEKLLFLQLTLPEIVNFFEGILEQKMTEFEPAEEPSDKEVNGRKSIKKVNAFEIELISFLSAVNEELQESITKKSTSSPERIITIVKEIKIYEVVIKNMLESELAYIRTLYIEYLETSCKLLALFDKKKILLSELVNHILQRLFLLLRNQEVTALEQIIQGRQYQSNKESFLHKNSLEETEILVHEQQKFSQGHLNLESKYAQIIELWNSVKFYVKFSIQIEIHQLPVVSLLSLILQSFPFSSLTFTTVESFVSANFNLYQKVQEDIKNVTGLKKQVLEIFDILWEKFNLEIIQYLVEKGDPRILVHGKIDAAEVLKSLSRSKKMEEIAKYTNPKRYSLPKGVIHYNQQILALENEMMYFLYLFIMYCSTNSMKNKKVSTFLDYISAILKVMKTTTHIQTKLWLLEIINLIGHKLIINKDNGIENCIKLKLELQDLVKEIIDELIIIIIRGKSFTHKTQIKTGFFNMFSKEEKQSSFFEFIRPYPPSIFALYQPYKEKKKNKQQRNLEVYDLEHTVEEMLFTQTSNLNEGQFCFYLGICVIKTVQHIGNSVLMSVFDENITKVASIIRDILTHILPICENKSEENQLNLELVAQYLDSVLTVHGLRQDILKNMRKNIIEIFMGNDFFKCTKKSLTHWKSIIDYCTQSHDLLGELLSKQGLFEGIFTRKAQATRQKIKSFQRVCFVIYSGRIDKYENKLRTVLESLNDVMKEENPSPALLILILFCIRILFIRLSQNSLNRMFRSIWPGLITLLIQIFKQDTTSKNINLLLAALKVVELIHALELEEFNLHKWMFIFDFFGIRLESYDADSHSIDKQKSTRILTPFEFKPYLSCVLPQYKFKCTFKPIMEEHMRYTEPTKRKLVVNEANVDSEEELRNHAFILMQYIIDLNQKRVEVDKKEIEDLIEGDFISLDDYIFQIS